MSNTVLGKNYSLISSVKSQGSASAKVRISTALPYTSFRTSGIPFLLTRSESEIQHKPLFREVKEDGETTFINFDEVLERAGTGQFQYVLLFVCGLIYMSCSVNSGIMAFILPASKCRLKVSDHERGLIFSCDLVGNVLGTFCWSAISDTKGRKFALLFSLFIETASAIATAFSFHKYMLVISRFCNGFGTIGSIGVVFAYTSDFIVPKWKDQFLSILEGFWGIGMILVPTTAMIILPLGINKHLGFVLFESWNLYALVHASLPLTSFILLLFLPESPGYLLYQKKARASLRVLRKIYMFNKGRKSEFNISLPGASEDILYSQKGPGIIDYLKQMFVQKQQLLEGKYRSRILKICLISFLTQCSYLTVRMWIPALLERQDYERKINGNNMTFCEAAIHVAQSVEEDVPCKVDIPNDVYINAIIMSSSVVPFTAALFFALDRLGKNELLIFITAMAGVSCLMLCTAISKSVIIIFCSVFEASSELIETMLFLFVVHLFPASVCGIALSLTVAFGRIGAVFGNAIFGTLLDKYCDFPMYAFAATLLGSVSVELILPRIEIWD